LSTLGRIHTAEQAIQSVQTAQSTGLRNLSLDLIYGIPGQTIASWKDSLAQALLLQPTHISAYELTPEQGTLLYHLLESRSLALPEEELVLDMYDCAIDTLTASGHEHYEISNYAIPGYLCMHNMNYWERGEYLSAGAGAHSFIRGCRSKNTGDIQEYIDKLGRNLIPEAESGEVSCEEALREFVFLGMRKTEGIRLTDADALGLDLLQASENLVSAGLIEVSEAAVRLTRKGLPLSNSIIVRLFEGLRL